MENRIITLKLTIELIELCSSQPKIAELRPFRRVLAKSQDRLFRLPPGGGLYLQSETAGRSQGGSAISIYKVLAESL